MAHYEETKTLAARHGTVDSLPKDEAAALVAAATGGWRKPNARMLRATASTAASFCRGLLS